MQTRTKSALLLLVVLVLGAAIGILLSGVMHNRRMERIARLRTGPGIAQLTERAVEPLTDEQRVRVREVMQDAAPRFAELFERTHTEATALADSVMSELEPILTPEQMEHLRDRLEMRWRRPPGEFRRGGGGRGPPLGLPPGEGDPPAPPPPPE